MPLYFLILMAMSTICQAAQDKIYTIYVKNNTGRQIYAGFNITSQSDNYEKTTEAIVAIPADTPEYTMTAPIYRTLKKDTEKNNPHDEQAGKSIPANYLYNYCFATECFFWIQGRDKNNIEKFMIIDRGTYTLTMNRRGHLKVGFPHPKKLVESEEKNN